MMTPSVLVRIVRAVGPCGSRDKHKDDTVHDQGGCCVACRGDVAAEPVRLGSLVSGCWQNKAGDLCSPVLTFPPPSAPRPISSLFCFCQSLAVSSSFPGWAVRLAVVWSRSS